MLMSWILGLRQQPSLTTLASSKRKPCLPVYAQAHKWGANHPFAATTQEVTGIATTLKASLSMFNIAAAKQLVRLVD